MMSRPFRNWCAPIPDLVVALLAACALPAATAAQTAAGSATPWISIIGEPPYIMPADGETATISLLVTLAAAAAPKDVTVTLLEVRYEKLLDDRLTNAFSIDSSVDRGAGRGPSILVKVVNVGSLRPGGYQLRIGAKHAKLGQVSPFTVMVDRPGVELEQPGKVSLDLLYNFPLISQSRSTVYPQALRLTQSPASKFSRISEAVLYAGPFRSGEKRSQGTLELNANTPVAPGEPLFVSVTPKNFPAGVSTGSIEVRGRDLNAPHAVEIEVRARHSPGWVIVLIVSGLVLGFWSRVVLQRRIELAKSRAQSADVVTALEKALFRTPDKNFSEKVSEAFVALRAAIGGSDRAAIDQRVTEANTALADATTDLETRIAQTHERLKAFQAVGAPTANLPPEMAQLVGRTSEVSTRVAELLDKLDETRARTALDALERKLGSEVTAVFARWRTMLPTRFRDLQQLQFSLQKASVDELITNLRELEQRATQLAMPRDIPTLGSALDTVDEIQAFASARVVWLRKTLVDDVAEFEKLFVERNGATDPAIGEIHTMTSDIADQLDASATLLDPGKPWYDSATRDGSRAAFEKSLDIVRATHQRTARADELNTFDKARKEQQYFDAVRSLPLAISKLKAGTAPARGAHTPFEPPKKETREVAAPEPVPTMSVEPVERIKARTVRDLARAEFAQALIAAILITGLGYVLFAEKFIGTLTDLATVFMWGFTLDISISKLLEVAAPLTKARSS